MRILLRSRTTNKFFVAGRTWTDDPAEALDFHFIARAEDYAGTWRLKDVEVAFAFEEGEGLKVLPARVEQRLAA
jgi:hypothetical protein